MLLDAERTHKHHIFSDDTFAVVASRVGMQDQKIISGKVGSVRQLEFGIGPHSVIITGALHFTEIQALTSLTENIDEPTDNSQSVNRIEAQMVQLCSKSQTGGPGNAQDSERWSTDSNKGISETLENAECYITDAEGFLRQGKLELAVLSIGYAEGLIDAIRYQKE